MAANPQLALKNLMTQRPEIQTILNLSQKNGASLQQIAQIMAQQKGIDLNNLINQLNN